MNATTTTPDPRTPELLGQTVVVLGGSAGIGLATARRARAEGAEVIVTGRHPGRLADAARELGAAGSAAFDAADADSLARFFDELPAPVDHVMVAAGEPFYALLGDLDFDRAHDAIGKRLLTALHVAREAVGRVRPGGTLLFMGGTGARRPAVGLAVAAAINAAMPALIANLAVELAPVRVNLVAAGFVDTPLSASLLGDDLNARREELRATLPIHRVVEPADVAALAVHIMSNTALTGATYDVDGGEQVV